MVCLFCYFHFHISNIIRRLEAILVKSECSDRLLYVMRVLLHIGKTGYFSFLRMGDYLFVYLLTIHAFLVRSILLGLV